jgi:hypothetical protein
MPDTTVAGVTPRPPRPHKPQGSYKSMPEVWDPPRHCERDGRIIFPRVGDDRTLCRQCQRELARAK